MDILEMKRLAGMTISLSDLKLKEGFSSPPTKMADTAGYIPPTEDKFTKVDNNPGINGVNFDAVATGGIIECPYCGSKMAKNDFYDHTMSNHKDENKEDTGKYDDLNNNQPQNTNDVDTENGEISFQVSPEPFSGSGGLGFSESEKVNEEIVDATVWNKTVDKDESPNPYPEEDDSVKIPKEVMDALSKEIDELHSSAEALEQSDALTAEFYHNSAYAMEEIRMQLKRDDAYGMKMAQICLTKLMSPIVQKIPASVVDYITRGGQVQTVSALFKKIKN